MSERGKKKKKSGGNGIFVMRELHLLLLGECAALEEFGKCIRWRSAGVSSLKCRGSFLCDGYNDQNNLLGADDCLARRPQTWDRGEDVSF